MSIIFDSKLPIGYEPHQLFLRKWLLDKRLEYRQASLEISRKYMLYNIINGLNNRTSKNGKIGRKSTIAALCESV